MGLMFTGTDHNLTFVTTPKIMNENVTSHFKIKWNPPPQTISCLILFVFYSKNDTCEMEILIHC